VLWPARWPLQALKDKAEDIGIGDFDQEFRNKPVSKADQEYKDEWFEAHYYTEEEIQGRRLEGSDVLSIRLFAVPRRTTFSPAPQLASTRPARSLFAALRARAFPLTTRWNESLPSTVPTAGSGRDRDHCLPGSAEAGSGEARQGTTLVHPGGGAKSAHRQRHAD